MAAKYYIYAGGRWCEVETQRGGVEGFRTRARFCALKGRKLRLARSATVLRALRALAADSGCAKGAVRDAAPLSQRHRRRRRRSRRDTHAQAHHHHCCSHHNKCDVNTKELREKPVPLTPAVQTHVTPTPSAVQSPRKRKRYISSSEEDQSLQKPDNSPAAKARELLQKFFNNSINSREDKQSEGRAQSRLTLRKGLRPRNNISVVVSSDSVERIVKPAVSSERSHKNRNSKVRNKVVISESSDEDRVKSPVKVHQASSKSAHKNRNKEESINVVNSDSSDEEHEKAPVELNRASSRSSHKNRNKKESINVVNSGSSEEEHVKSAIKRNQPSLQKPSHKNRNRKETNVIVNSDSSDDEHVKSPVKRNQPSLQKPSHKNRDRKETNVIVNSNSSDDEHVKSPVKRNQPSLQKPSHKNRDRKEINAIVNSDSSDDEHVKSPVKRNQPSLQKPSDKNHNRLDPGSNSNKQEQKISPKKRQRQRSKNGTFVSKDDTEKLVRSLLKDSSPEDESVGHQSDSSETQAKELVIDDEDVGVLRRFLAKNGIGDLNKFDNNEEYKRRVFYKLNPLVCIARYRPLENLLRQKMTIKEFARNLGLRSVAEVTPEKRYRMRRSTKQARTAATDSETDKENVVKPKRRKLWNNDKELFNSVTSRSSEQRPREVPKPVLNEDSSKDTTDSDTEFKKKVREQLARKSKQRATIAESAKIINSGVTDKEEQRSTRSMVKTPRPLKEQAQNKLNGESKKEKDVLTAEGSEDITRRTRSSDRGLRIPDRTLKEQNKASESTESAFETTKNSPKKGIVEKGKNAAVSKGAGPGSNKELLRPQKDSKTAKVGKIKPAAVNSLSKPVKFRKSSVANGREYTSLEDQAIVAWVSVGGRERRVNGNAVWRDLQTQYQRITGQNRSWHSLRNRYLRYVLPAIGSMALPPAQVSRLRAAAATGLMKVRAAQRRNSIFGAPTVRSASTASAKARELRPREEPEAKAKPKDTPPKSKVEETPPKAKAPSPRPSASPSYSAVTRKFASRVTRASSATSSPLPVKKRRRPKNW